MFNENLAAFLKSQNDESKNLFAKIFKQKLDQLDYSRSVPFLKPRPPYDNVQNNSNSELEIDYQSSIDRLVSALIPQAAPSVELPLAEPQEIEPHSVELPNDNTIGLGGENISEPQDVDEIKHEVDTIPSLPILGGDLFMLIGVQKK